MDVRDPAAVKAAADEVEAKLGLPSVVINNAAGNFIQVRTHMNLLDVLFTTGNGTSVAERIQNRCRHCAQWHFLRHERIRATTRRQTTRFHLCFALYSQLFSCRLRVPCNHNILRAYWLAFCCAIGVCKGGCRDHDQVGVSKEGEETFFSQVSRSGMGQAWNAFRCHCTWTDLHRG